MGKGLLHSSNVLWIEYSIENWLCKVLDMSIYKENSAELHTADIQQSWLSQGYFPVHHHRGGVDTCWPQTLNVPPLTSQILELQMSAATLNPLAQDLPIYASMCTYTCAYVSTYVFGWQYIQVHMEVRGYPQVSFTNAIHSFETDSLTGRQCLRNKWMNGQTDEYNTTKNTDTKIENYTEKENFNLVSCTKSLFCSSRVQTSYWAVPQNYYFFHHQSQTKKGLYIVLTPSSRKSDKTTADVEHCWARKVKSNAKHGSPCLLPLHSALQLHI